MKPIIDNIIQYIESLSNIPEIRNKTTLVHLLYIRSILRQGEHEDQSINIAKIVEAIHYIENIPTGIPSMFFAPKKILMADILKQHEEIILPAHERQQNAQSL